MPFDLANMFDAPREGSVPQNYLDMLSQVPNTNAASSYGVYMPRRTQVQEDYISGDMGAPNDTSGYVRPHLNNQIAHIATSKFPSVMGNLDTMFHEATHTVQPTSGYGRMKGLPFEDYDPNQTQPPAEEILATLRANEALAPKGRTWDKSSSGKEVIDRMKMLNPDMTSEGVKRYIDVKMFPEHQVMHQWDPKDTTQVKPDWYSRHVDIIKNIFK